jgi:hypothetical protein
MSPCNRLYLAVYLSVGLTFACAHDRPRQQYRSVDDIVRSATILEGQTVSVKGYLRFGDDSRNLWSNKESYTYLKKDYRPPSDPAWNRCIALYDIDGWREKLLSMNNHYVLVSGIVRHYPTRDGEITIDTCSDLGISIGSAELAPSASPPK